MSKKTETIEIRVSPELKAKLQEQSRDAGQTMSGFLRERINADEPGRATMSKIGALTMTKMTKRVAVAGLPALAVAGIYALTVPAAAVANPDARVAFAEMDLNGDGVITLDEYQGLMEQQFDLEVPEGEEAALTEDETALTEDETLESLLPESCKVELGEEIDLDPQKLAELEMAAMDVDGDGAITFDELNGVMKREAAEEFLAMDTDGDGYLSSAEMINLGDSDDLGDAEEVFSDACDAALAEIMSEDDMAIDMAVEDAAMIAEADAAEGVVADEDAVEETLTDEAILEDADLAALEEALEDEFPEEEAEFGEDEEHLGRIIVAKYDTDGDGRISLIEYLGE